MQRVEISSIIYQTFEKMKKVPQSYLEHPEGSAYNSAALLWNEFAEDSSLFDSKTTNPVAAAATCLHVGKVITTRLDMSTNRYNAIGYAFYSIEFATNIVPLIWPNIKVSDVVYLIRTFKSFSDFSNLSDNDQTILLDETEALGIEEYCWDLSLLTHNVSKNMKKNKNNTLYTTPIYRRFDIYIKCISTVELARRRVLIKNQ